MESIVVNVNYCLYLYNMTDFDYCLLYTNTVPGTSRYIFSFFEIYSLPEVDSSS